MSLFVALCASLTGISALPLAAQIDPLAVDQRIVELQYSPNVVYPISISEGHATVVQLEDGEAVESIVVGDSEGWIVEPTASADQVVVKPTPTARNTNMTVITTKRTYAFTLDNFPGSEVFLMRFNYAGQETANPNLNVRYQFRGNRALYPRLMSDNGRTTSIYWPANTPFPAVFAVDKGGKEIAVEYRAAGDGLIVDGVYEQMVFRSGDKSARAYRKTRRRR